MLLPRSCWRWQACPRLTGDDMSVQAVIAVVASIAAVVFGWAAFVRNKKQDDTEEGKLSGTVLSDLGYIKANTEEIKAEQKEQRKTNIELITRLTAVEESAKQAHKRIDELKHE